MWTSCAPPCRADRPRRRAGSQVRQRGDRRVRARRGTASLRSQLTGIDQKLAAAAATSPALSLTDGDPDADELKSRWKATSPDLKGKIIDQLMVVTILPSVKGRGGGGNTFNPDLINIKPRW